MDGRGVGGTEGGKTNVEEELERRGKDYWRRGWYKDTFQGVESGRVRAWAAIENKSNARVGQRGVGKLQRAWEVCERREEAGVSVHGRL